MNLGTCFQMFALIRVECVSNPRFGVEAPSERVREASLRDTALYDPLTLLSIEKATSSVHSS